MPSMLTAGPGRDNGRAPDPLCTDARPVYNPRLEGRRRPLRRIGLLHVVHEIYADRLRRACVQCREDSGMSIGRDLLGADIDEPRTSFSLVLALYLLRSHGEGPGRTRVASVVDSRNER